MVLSGRGAGPRITFIGLDIETSAWLANLATVLLTIAAALAGLLAWKWNNEAQAAKDQIQLDFQQSSTLALDDANRRAQSAEAELEVLKRKIAPRELPRPVFDHLVDLLKQSEARGPVRVGWSNNAECATYGARFAEALQTAGWTVDTTIILDLNGRGVFVVVQDQKTAPNHATSLLKALIGAGIEVKGIENEQFGRGAQVSLLITEKP